MYIIPHFLNDLLKDFTKRLFIDREEKKSIVILTVKRHVALR